MKKRLKEIEEEAGALREMQAKVEKEMGAVQGRVFQKKFWVICRVLRWKFNLNEELVLDNCWVTRNSSVFVGEWKRLNLSRNLDVGFLP